MTPRPTLVALAAITAAALASHAQVWVEGPDADGQTPQNTVGGGPLVSIVGMLGNAAGADYEDAFRIRITNPAAFRASTVGGASFDTQLFLFDSSGRGVTFNDDSTGLQSTITGMFVPGPGVYTLAISAYDNDPRDVFNNQIWQDSPFGVERAPDGPGAMNVLAAWDHSSGSNAGAYRIDLQGAECFIVPTPGAVALAGLGGLLTARRRR